MAYFNTNIIARKGYAGRRVAGQVTPAYSAMAHEIRHATSGMGSILDDAWSAIKGGASTALDFYGATEKQAGANALLTAQNQAPAAQQAAAAQQGGISTTTLLLLGGVGLAAFLIIRKK